MLLQEKTPTPSAPSHRRVMGVCTGPKLLKTKRTIQKETRDHFFFLFVSSSIHPIVPRGMVISKPIGSQFSQLKNVAKGNLF
jgi:hypothetical protein